MAGPSRPPPSLLLVSPASPATARATASSSRSPGPSSASPFRYVHLPLDEKIRSGPPPISTVQQQQHPLALRTLSLSPSPLPPPPARRAVDHVKPWLGIASWALTSAAFLFALAFWKTELFAALDRLAHYVQALGAPGYAVLFALIAITTIPPVPLYSTLIVLSGYTYGALTGFVLSYAAALSGALAVFLFSRRVLFPQQHHQHQRASLAPPSSLPRSLARALRAIERKPALLLVIRIAPYPYNLLNVLLAASRIPLGTYAGCTALALLKLGVHTSLGASLHSFAEDEGGGGGGAYTVAGVVLCVVVFVYLAWVARRAVDQELGDEDEGEEGEMREVGTP